MTRNISPSVVRPKPSSRRQLIVGLGAATTAAGALLLLPARARAQAARNDKIGMSLGDQIVAANDLVDFVDAQPLAPNADLEGTVVNRTTTILLQTRRYLSNVQEPQLIDYVALDQLAIADAIVQNNMSLRPSAEAVQQAASRKPQDASDRPDLGGVLLDIALETIGLKEFFDAIQGLVKGDKTLTGFIYEIGEAFRKANPWYAARLIVKFLRALTTPPRLLLLEQVIGKKAVVRMVAVLDAEFVPFLGWALLAAQFGMAIRHNWPRIQKFL